MGYIIGNGFMAVVSFFANMFQRIIISAAVTSPIWIVLLIAAVIILKRRRPKTTETPKIETSELSESE
jgi:hypothetical protein